MKRVLIVGDDVFKTEALRALDNINRFELGYAADADGAVIDCLGDMPDCILLEEVGYVRSLMLRVRALPGGDTAKVIAALRNETAKDELFELGVDLTVMRPLHADTLKPQFNQYKLS